MHWRIHTEIKQRPLQFKSQNFHRLIVHKMDCFCKNLFLLQFTLSIRNITHPTECSVRDSHTTFSRYYLSLFCFNQTVVLKETDFGIISSCFYYSFVPVSLFIIYRALIGSIYFTISFTDSHPHIYTAKVYCGHSPRHSRCYL